MSEESSTPEDETSPGSVIVIDEAELDLIRSYLTSEGFADFVDACLAQIARHIEDLEARSSGARRLADLAHAMVGSAGVIGAVEVVAIARALEKACKVGSEPELDELVTKLIAAWTEAAGELRRIGAFQP